MLKRIIMSALTLGLLISSVTALPTAKEFIDNFEVRNEICSDLTVACILFGPIGEDKETIPKLIAICVSHEFDKLTNEQKMDATLYCLYLYGFYRGIMYSKGFIK